MESSLTKSQFLLKISELSNQVEGITDKEISSIESFQELFLDRYVSDDDEFKPELERKLIQKEVDLLWELYPNGARELWEIGVKEAREEVRIKAARNMKKLGDNVLDISKLTCLSIEEIEKL